MRLEEVLRRCVYGTTGYLASIDDLDALERTIVRNLPVLGTFAQVVVATNYADGQQAELGPENARLWRALVPDVVLIDSPRNRGHSIGTTDLDCMLVDHCRDRGQRWLCKGANDIHLSPAVLDIPVDEADFYYLNAVSYDAIEQSGFDLARFTGGFFYPQTTFYVIDVDAIDCLVDRRFLDRSWARVQQIPDYSGRIWEHLPGWACETLLKAAVQRNGLTRQHLMSDEQWRRVLDIVVEHRITDCSLKGLEINGICHGERRAELGDALRVGAP